LCFTVFPLRVRNTEENSSYTSLFYLWKKFPVQYNDIKAIF
jgi:hypothetical protein